MSGLLNITFTMALIVVSNLAALFMTEMSVISKTVSAQVPPLPSLPGREDSITDNQLPNLGDQAEPIQSTVPTTIPTPTIQITSHEDGNKVPAGELTIRGTSSDNEESNCQVYADVNDIAPLQNATAAGPSGDDDYSQWVFTYTQDYQLLTVGANELTAKISCLDGGGGGATIPMSEWHSVNVTGVAGGTSFAPTMSQTPLTEKTLGAELQPNVIPAPLTSPSSPFTLPEEPSEDSSQSQVEDEEDGDDGGASDEGDSGGDGGDGGDGEDGGDNGGEED